MAADREPERVASRRTLPAGMGWAALLARSPWMAWTFVVFVIAKD